MERVLQPTDEIMAFMRLLILVHLAATLIMVGVIWVIQVVHYPLFALVGEEGFIRYMGQHNVLITYVVLPAMLVEIGTAGLLALSRPSAIPAWLAWVGFALVILIWASTFFLQVPAHNILGGGFNLDAHVALVSTNWIRTILWSIRGVIALWMVWLLMQ